ncbi:MAG: Regulatory sensor-transducer, BlaR1/MecR1 family [Verrucomicrobiales bacterium]|nr:Regulatory sensor-transducer, BlaR1/MecR1 family [Verrucomicrobiales bacterium]
MSSPGAAAWLQLFGIVAAEGCLVVGLALVLHRVVHSASGRRMLWQTSFISLLILTLCELNGLGRAAGIFLFGQSPVEREFVVSQVSSNDQPLARSPEAVSFEPPAAHAKTENVSWLETWLPGTIWVIGFALVTARILFAQLLLITLRRRRKTICDPACRERIAFIAGRMGFHRKIVLLQTPNLTSPMAFGIFSPSIGLPQAFARIFTREQQDVMLAHEVAHLAARDPVWYLLADLISALLWWHPCVWWARRRLHASSELAADEAAAILENGPGTLAECLVVLGRQMTGINRWSWMGADGSGFRSNLSHRVNRLLNLGEGQWQPLRGWRYFFARTGAISSLVTLLIFTSGWIQRSDEPRAKTWQATLQQSWDHSVGFAMLSTAIEPNQNNSTVTVAFASPDPNEQAAVQPNTKGFKADPNTFLQNREKADPIKVSGTNHADVLNKAAAQVAIEVKLVELDETEIKKLGRDWIQRNTVFLATNQTASTATFMSGNLEAAKKDARLHLAHSQSMVVTGILTESHIERHLQVWNISLTPTSSHSRK